MRGSPASEHRLARSNTRDMNAGLAGERRRPLSGTLKTHDGTSIAPERQLSRRYPATSPDVPALMPTPALWATVAAATLSSIATGSFTISGTCFNSLERHTGRRRTYPGRPCRRGSRYTGEIGAAVDRASNLLRNLLETPENRRCSVEIEKMLERLSASLRWALGPSNELVVAVGSDLQPVYCVESELDNVILNLVINARDAMPDRGRVTIEATRSTAGPTEGVFAFTIPAMECPTPSPRKPSYLISPQKALRPVQDWAWRWLLRLPIRSGARPG